MVGIYKAALHQSQSLSASLVSVVGFDDGRAAAAAAAEMEHEQREEVDGAGQSVVVQ